MSRYTYEAFTRVWWVETIADIAEPSPTEINGGTDITGFLTKDGLNPPQNQNNVDNATLAEKFDAETVGSWGGSLELTCFRDNGSGADDAWDLFEWANTGYIVVRRGVAVATAAAASQKVEVYPVQSHQPVMQPTVGNENQRFKVMCAVTAEPNLKATVTT